MAQDAELKLKVSLDLAFFRQQLSTIGTQLAGQGIDLSAKIDQDDVIQQYKTLARTLEGKTIKLKVESNTLDSLVTKAANLKKNLEEFSKQDISLDVKIASNIADLRKSIKDKLPSIQINTELADPVNVDDFIRGVGKKVKEQVEKSYVGGGVPIATKLETPGTTSLIKALQKNFNNQDPLRAKVSTTPSITGKDVKAFRDAVKEKFSGISIDVNVNTNIPKGASQGSRPASLPGTQGRQAIDEIEKVLAQGASGALFGGAIERAQQNIAKQAILKRLEKQSLGAGGYNKPGLEKIIRDLGGTPSGKREDLVAQAKKLVQESDGIADAVFDHLKDLQMKLRPIRGQAQTSAARSMPNLNQMLDRIANLTENPRAAQRMLRMMPESRLTTDLVGAANKQAAIKEAGPGKFLDLRGKAFDPLLKVIAESFTDYTRSVNASNPWVGKIGSGITQLISRALTQSPEQMFGGRTPVAGQKLLPAAGQSSASRMMRSAFSGLPAIMSPQIGTENAPLSRAATYMLNKARRALEMPIGPSSPYLPGPFSGTATTPPRSFFQFGQGPQLPGAPVQAALPPAGTTTNYGGGGFFGYGGVTGKGQPPERGGAIVPFAPSTRLPEGYFESAKKYSAALEMARATSAKFTASQLPLVGGLREVASEFGFAIKQVFLFGAAYKALAFVQSLPGQILNAAKSQQQYNNALQTATQDTGTFAKELLYVDNVQRAFGLNLETTRTGFTKLYASMAPAGFDSGSIEKLFTGISAATAALQLTPDKAGRVIYAFGQMASKGQIMSEELKGQLGDVLPGALAIFAKAAGMSIKEFSKAMEDGEFVGSKFRDTFAKVADELMRRFGTGAQAAGKSLQGLLNTVQGDFKRTLESFAPLADAAAQAILGPLGGSLKQLSMSAQIATGEIERTFMQLKEAQKDLGDLRTGGADADQLRAAEQNVAALTARYKTLQQAAQDPVIAKQAQDIQLFTQELAKAGTFVMNTAKAIGSVLSPILNILGTNLTTVISLITSFYIGFQVARLAAMALMGILLTYRALSTILGFGPAALSANALAGAFNVLGVAATGATVKAVGLTRALQVFAATTIVGAIVGGIMFIAGAFGAMRDRAKEASDQSKNAAENAARAASMGDVMGVTTELNNELAKNRAVSKSLATLEKIYAREKDRMKLGYKPMISVEDMAALKQGADYSNEIAGILSNNQMKGNQFEIQAFRGQELERARRQAGQISAEVRKSSTILKAQQDQALEQQRKIGLNVPTPNAITEAEAPDEKGLKKAQQDAEQLAKQEQQRRIELANFDNDMDKIGFDYKMGLSDAQFEHEKRLIDELNNYELSGLNDMQARQLKFAQDLKRVKLDAEDAIRKAIQKTEAAQLNVTTAQRTAQAAGAPSMGGQAIFGNTGRTSQAAGWVHGHFQTNTASLATLIGDVVPVVKQLLSQGIPVELSGGQKFNTGMSDADITALLRKGASQHGHSGDGRSIDLFVPKGTAVPSPLSDVRDTGGRGGITGVLPGSGQSWVGHLDPRSKSGAKQSSASFSMDTKARTEGFDLIKEQAKASNQTALQQLEIQNALQLAYAQTASIIKANIDSIFPVEKQKLDLKLQQMRHNLLMQGMPQEYIDYEEKRTAAAEEGAMAVKVMQDNLVEAKSQLKVYNDAVASGTKLSVDQQANVVRLTGNIAALEEGLKNVAEQQREYNIAALESAIATMKQADALKAMEEVSGRINDAVEGVTGTYKSLFKEIAMGEDSVEALKKAQQALADQFLTMVFDMAMKPVEESMKNTLGKMFGVPDEKKEREKTITAMEKQLAELEASKKLQEGIKGDTAAIRNGAGGGATPAPPTPPVPGQATAASGTYGTQTHPFIKDAGNMYSTLPFNGQTGGMLQTLPFNGQTGGMLQTLPFNGGAGFLSSIGIDSEALSASITDSANAYSDQLGKIDTSVFESATALGTAGTELGKEGAAGKKWHESLGSVVGGLGMAAGSVMGIVAGINQIKEGGTSNVLGGIGMIASMAGSLLGSFGGMFGGGAGASSIVQGVDMPVSQMPAGMAFANGGIAFGGFRAFANGGTVSGPTLGLVGEGKYNEAIVPLPDGRSIPVQLGGRTARDLMGNSAPGMPQAPSLSMKFETTKINGVEYVSREQLEQAMAETRRTSIAGGAQRGMSMTLDKIKQSPSTRSSIGIR